MAQWGSLFEELAVNVAAAPPLRPTPLTRTACSACSAADDHRRERDAQARHPGRHARRELRAQGRASKSCTTLSERGRALSAIRPPRAEGGGCHAGADTLREAASSRASPKSSRAMRRIIRKAPHDQPQSMCPAFGSLRVGLRMRRTATVLSGIACCVYGLTFTSHFYGAQRSVGYVPFNSETLVTGKLFEDIRDAVHQLADPALYDTIVVTNLCVPTASRRAAAAAARPDQRRARDRHRRAGLRRARPMRKPRTCSRARCSPMRARRPSRAPSPRPRTRADKPTITLLGEMFPADPIGIGMMLAPLGLAAGPVVPTREWRELYAALDCAAVAAIHPFYTASVREFTPRAVRCPARRRSGATAPRRGSKRSARRAASRGRDRRRQERSASRDHAARSPGRRSRAASPSAAMKAPNCSSRACWSRAARTCAYVGTACPRTPWSEPDRDWLEARGIAVQYRAIAPAGHRRGRRIRPRSRDRHDAGRAARQGDARSRRSISPTSSRRGR